MDFKKFVYNKETKESNLAGVLYVILVTVVAVALIYYFFW
tara:strand:+ start:358 stop:477 length:120 start_codon:yes stop_codon:yes gene_type:complete